MTYRPLCQPIITPAQRIAAERERNRQWLNRLHQEHKDKRITNAMTDPAAPWTLFQPVARSEGLDFAKHPSLMMGKRVAWRQRP